MVREVNGQPVHDVPHADVVHMIKDLVIGGKYGDKVRLTVLSPPEKLKVPPRKVSAQPVELKMPSLREYNACRCQKDMAGSTSSSIIR